MSFPIIPRLSKILLLSALLSGCAIFGVSQFDNLDELYGKPKVRERVASNQVIEHDLFLNQVKPIIDNRCVVCHGCYDAACQLKLSSVEGIDRGASKEDVYAVRLLADKPSRLFTDEDDAAGWRKRGFHPVLNEREQTREGNLISSLVFQMLALKSSHPLPNTGNQPLPDEHFRLGIDREQYCPTIEQFGKYSELDPFGGMPYALPALNEEETRVMVDWLADGAKMSHPAKPSIDQQLEIEKWESFLNGDSYKQQLASRYIYEHLFLAHIYFDQLPEKNYYKMVRSSTPPGTPISLIKTRLPFEDPGVDRVYYRLWQDPATIVTKTHLPYAFNSKRLEWIKSLFIDEPYQVTKMPDYQRSVAGNPFVAFEAIPVRSRYRFMLEESRYTIMGFIKGPVCRGQVALNSIQDHFWVTFVSPENQNTPMLDEFLMEQGHNLVLPGAKAGYSSLVSSWTSYSTKNRKYLMAKMDAMEHTRPDDSALTMDYIWDGDGNNKNAALTVFRHRDSATVVNGFVGEPPKTAWLINYPLLERIHYLLVAEFDVYGNLGHQLSTRLYMDFLRQEGETSFLTLLPKGEREKLQAFWYRDADEAMSHHKEQSQHMFDRVTGLDLRTDQPQLELYELLQKRLAPVLERKYDIDHPDVPDAHQRLLKLVENLAGNNIQLLPEVSLLSIEEADGQSHLYSILRNQEHSNITGLFEEDETHLPEEDYLTVTRGIVGDYPSVLLKVSGDNLDRFGDSISQLSDGSDYTNFITQFGVRRSHPGFWAHSDNLLETYARMEPVEGGLLDYNRLENR